MTNIKATWLPTWSGAIKLQTFRTMSRKLPRLPDLLRRKIYKTGQTRGASLDEIYQNRVSRNSTTVIRYENYRLSDEVRSKDFESGFVVLINPSTYFESSGNEPHSFGLELGKNMLLFYNKREDWERWNPTKHGFQMATSRVGSLGGHYVARIAGTTQSNTSGKPIRHGFDSTNLRGLGIREYEYASQSTIDNCRVQLTDLYWRSAESISEACKYGMSREDAELHSRLTREKALSKGLAREEELFSKRFVNKSGLLVCPLCLEVMHASSFYSRVEQVQGRETHDQTVTETSLFHLEELRPGSFNHKTYNLGWGHHHCNVVVKDSGIKETIAWMERVVSNNRNSYQEASNES